jgi:hypothetical protein
MFRLPNKIFKPVLRYTETISENGDECGAMVEGGRLAGIKRRETWRNICSGATPCADNLIWALQIEPESPKVGAGHESWIVVYDVSALPV